MRPRVSQNAGVGHSMAKGQIHEHNQLPHIPDMANEITIHVAIRWSSDDANNCEADYAITSLYECAQVHNHTPCDACSERTVFFPQEPSLVASQVLTTARPAARSTPRL